MEINKSNNTSGHVSVLFSLIGSIVFSFLLQFATLHFIISPAFAEAESSDTNKVSDEQDEDSDAMEVLVTAGRGLEQNRLEIPQSVSSITRDELDAREYTDLDDAIRREPGVGMAPAEGNPNYWQEGFTLRGLGAQRVLTLTDGVRQAGQGIGYGGGNLSLYDSYGVERIEVIRGPASVLYGTDAFGGVVNIITREPEKRAEFGMNAGAKYTFDGARTLHRYGTYLDVGDDKVAAVLNAGYVDAGRPNLPDDVDPMGGSFENFGFGGKLDYFISSDTKFRLIGNIDRNNDISVLDSEIPLPIAVFGPPGSFDLVSSPLFFEFPQYRRSLLGGELITENISDSFEYFKTGVYWQQLRREFHRETAFYPTFSPGFAGPPTFIDPTASVTRSIVDTSDTVNTIEWHNQARFRLATDNLLTTGFDLGYDTSDLPETESQQVVAMAGVGPIMTGAVTTVNRKRADATQLRLGLYAQDNQKIDQFEVVTGIRGDSFNVKDDVSDFDDDVYGLSGSLSGLYHVTGSNSLYSTFATGFRAPDLGERFQTGIVNLGAPSQIIGTPDLDPERANSVEIGSKNDFGSSRLDVAGYYNNVTDYIGLVDRGVVNGLVTDQYDNIGTVNLWGTEVTFNTKVTDNLELYANAARTWTDEETKIDVADWMFNYGTYYTWKFDSESIKRVIAGLHARSVLESEDKTASRGKDAFNAGSFTTLDFTLNIDLMPTKIGKVSLVSGVRNIFDRSYKEPFFDQLQPGINGYIGIEVAL